MRVFMLGWEFPPFISGGLGAACYGLTQALSRQRVDILFVLPRPAAIPFSTHLEYVPRAVGPGSSSLSDRPVTQMRLDDFDHVTFRTVDANLRPYVTPEAYARAVTTGTQVPEATAPSPPLSSARRRHAAPAPPAPLQVDTAYAETLLEEVQRYAALAVDIARDEQFDVVHAHDWMTYPAGLAVAALKGVPMVAHVHSTEIDRAGGAGGTIYQPIFDIERRGMQGAMRVIAVSHLTRTTCEQQYGLDPSKVDVVYNAIDLPDPHFDPERYRIRADEKIVLFLGRITAQKGPEYFLAAAKRVLEVMDNVKFVMAGGGDLTRRTIEMATAMGIGHRVLFTGWLDADDVDRVYRQADLYVMPSVSEPFGLASLEAMSRDVPVLVSRQSGVSEILHHVLKVDFWDVEEMANKIVAVLKYPPLAESLRAHGSFEVRQLTWADAAKQTVNVYQRAIQMINSP